MSSQNQQRPVTQLRSNYLSYFENVAQSLGVMAPSGALGTIIPLLAGKSGNGTWLVILGISGVFCLILFCINQFAKRHISAGSVATYARLGLGRRGAMVTGWAYLIGLGLGISACAVCSAYYIDIVFRQLMGGGSGPLRAIAFTSFWVLATWWIAHRDVKLSTKVMFAIEWSTLALMVSVVGVATVTSSHWIDRSQLRLTGVTPGGFQLALAFGFTAFAGVESVTTLSEESVNAKGMLRQVILGCLIPISVLEAVMAYCLVGYAHQHALPLDRLEAPFDSIAKSLNLPALGFLSSIGIALSCFACSLGMANAAARILFSMAREGLFLKSFALVHPMNLTPARALALISAAALLCPSVLLAANYSLSDCINYITQVASFGSIVAYFVVCLATPCYLFANKLLRPWHLLIVLASLFILGFVLVFSIVPVPPPPWSYFPYIFLVLLGAGVLISLCCSRKQSHKISESGVLSHK